MALVSGAILHVVTCHVLSWFVSALDGCFLLFCSTLVREALSPSHLEYYKKLFNLMVVTM